ncbi:hypothetical protein [Pleomorphovibrio marinus]|uniref:hypothetical protein n=1 Tax=Pleomorphovibrio marinus TaxID=2164132 RepID=UPI000E0AF108|nr:hypothetical protein [Pleomorphovibrio marinus]
MKILLFTISLIFSYPVLGQINITLLHQLVEDSKNEHDRQSEAKANQAKNAINEEVNRNLMGEVKEKYRTVQERFAKLNLLMEAVGLAAMTDSLVRTIIGHQEQIVIYCQNDPFLIPLALETEKLFVKRSFSLMNYLIGLMASIGELNQMKVSERRLLLQHVLYELREINRLSRATSQTLESHIRRKLGGSPYPQYLLEVSGTVDEILANIQRIRN